MFIRDLDVQRISHSVSLPSDEELQRWVEKALDDYHRDAEILVRIIDIQEITELNGQYRHKNGATNILSFPFEVPKGVEGVNLLGDMVVCAEVLAREAEIQKKSLKDHWAHIIIHGTLHLIGYDHVNEKDAIVMEAKEIFILKQLQVDNPYQEKEVND